MIDIELVIVGEYDLKIIWHKDKASEEEVAAVRDVIDRYPEVTAAVELLPGYMGSGWSFIEPEQIPGALTSAPIIGRDVLLMSDWMENAEADIKYLEIEDARAIISILMWRLQQGNRRLEWYEEQMYVSGDLWYYDRYMLERFMEVLYERGEVMFDRVRTEEN